MQTKQVEIRGIQTTLYLGSVRSHKTWFMHQDEAEMSRQGYYNVFQALELIVGSSKRVYQTIPLDKAYSEFDLTG